jgi:predicted AAA+ superfamily ATPase
MIPRMVAKKVTDLSRGYPALAITGPRQSGKTTLARAMFPDKPYLSLENPDTRRFAAEDPRSFLEKYRRGAVLDEIQRCPELFSYLQGILDETREMGRFVLTGSQQFGLLSSITQSLAGRIAMIELLPFSCTEVYKVWPALDQVLYEGLYPPVHDRKLDPTTWYASYVQTYVERDVRQLVNVRDLSAFQRFVRLCAGRTGQLLNLSQLAADTGITHNTARAWLSILQAGYLIHLLPPHHRNFNKRIIKSPKLYFLDTGLAAWLLGIQAAVHVETHPLRGALFETLIITEMIKARSNRGLPSNLYFWRDREGHEIDVVVDVAGRLLPVEIKSAATISPDWYKNLDYFTSLQTPPQPHSFLVYGGTEDLKYRGTQVLGWNNLEPLTRFEASQFPN